MLIISDHQQSSETQSIFRCLIEVMWRMCQTGSCTVNFDLDFPFTSIINIKNHINNLQVKREVGINITLYTSNVWLGGGFTILFFFGSSTQLFICLCLFNPVRSFFKSICLCHVFSCQWWDIAFTIDHCFFL